MMEINLQIQRAYKKLKASVYFDKTQLVLRNNIVEFEGCLEDIDARLEEIADILIAEDSTEWDSYVKELLKRIKVLTFPKSISSKNNDKIILNENPAEINVEQAQYFIDMSVEGQILGILWVLTIGAMLDEEVYEHSYGNRLKKNLLNEETENTTFSPYLFKPYFEQYESWRDIGLKYAENCLDKKQDVLIFTMDLKRYFYSVNFTETQFEDFYNSYSENQREIGESELTAVERINQFVFKVMKQFSSCIPEYSENVFLPIGFFPSNILSNWYLNKFDSAISDRWNPVYYGRYVDDIIIVEKIEKNSHLYKQANGNILTQEKVIEFFLCNCSSKNNQCDKSTALLLRVPDNEEKEKPIYKINSAVLEDEKANIVVQNDKIKVFYFKANSSKAILSCFRNELNKNKSEFRYLPEDEAVLQEYDYSEIFDLNTSDTVNKFRGVDGIAINKFNLSKFLGKYHRISSLINDKKERKFEKDILTIFDTKTIIENYIFWERVIEILVLSNNFELTYKFVEKIMNAIENIEFSQESKSLKVRSIKTTLALFLHSAICRSLSLNWNVKVKEMMNKIDKLSEKRILKLKNRGMTYDYEIVCRYRQNYCLTRMNDKSVMPVLIDAILDTRNAKIFNDNLNVNLSNFRSFLQIANNLDFQQSDYKYYPFIISLQDIEIGLFLAYMVKSADSRPKDEVFKMAKALYLKLNYLLEENYFYIVNNIDVYKKKNMPKCPNGLSVYATKSNIDKKDHRGKFKIAIANAKLFDNDFIKVLTDSPNRSYDRYKKLAKIVNQAIDEKADILVMPEAYVPFEWLSIIARTSAKNQMAIIAGIEHTNYNNEIRNFTATILPYSEDEYNFAHINIHNKVHYSPEEVRIIEGYGYNYKEGDSYDLFNWNDLWFSVYCCFELASIQDRALFQAYVDATIAVEWNHDTNYYSNIIESLGRDLHCYCVQVNTSNYGDSRIVSPTKTELKDIVRTKGGNNDTVLVSDIDVYALRNFQIKGYELQKDDKSFKPTPPDFNIDIVKQKINRSL